MKERERSTNLLGWRESESITVCEQEDKVHPCLCPSSSLPCHLCFRNSNLPLSVTTSAVEVLVASFPLYLIARIVVKSSLPYSQAPTMWFPKKKKKKKTPLPLHDVVSCLIHLKYSLPCSSSLWPQLWAEECNDNESQGRYAWHEGMTGPVNVGFGQQLWGVLSPPRTVELCKN